MQAADIWSKSLFPTLTDFLIIGVYLIILFILANNIKNRKIENNPVYKYYVWGLFAKVVGAIAMGLIYTLYYREGGDTTNYYRSSEAMVNLLFQSPNAFFRIMAGEMSGEVRSFFTSQTGYPMYWGKFSSFAVVRAVTPFTLLAFKNYFTATILFAWFFYGGTWKLLLLASKLYPKYTKSFAFGILFFPSVLFWGSGISKDALALAATGWFLYAMYHVFVERKKLFWNTTVLLLSALLILSVKAYIFVALVPGGFIWLAWSYLKKLSNPVFRFLATPLTVALFLGFGLLLLSLLSPALGEYGTLDGIIQKSIITYEDHSRAQQYGENFYSLGSFDGTRWNYFSKAPAAIMAGLFRPYLWEVRNPVMLLAAIENTAFLILVMVIIWRTGFVKTWKIAFDEPLVVFSLSFAIVFAFAVGISTANFGALVRLKIPLLPFLAVGLFTLLNRSLELKEENIKELRGMWVDKKFQTNFKK
jgi:hypothetical protein